MVDMALAGLRWAASPIVKKLIADASTYLDVDMTHELQELEVTVLPQLDLVIEAAEKSPHKDKLRAWLQRLKEAFYDTEDLLDEHEYNQLKRKAKSGKSPLLEEDATSVKSTILKPFRAVKSKASNLLPENRRLIRKMNELKAILAQAKGFRELLGLSMGSSAGCPAVPTTAAPVARTTSLPTSKVFGRDKDRDCIVDILLDKATAVEESSTDCSNLAIVGAGGMGKSTLAQYVYNDKRIEQHFDVRMWVCISRKLDVHHHTREIIESAAKGECPRVDNLDTLQCKLRDMLQKSQKFLLVLDDVWFQESYSETEWQQLLAPLVSQQVGSKILVTSRRDTLPAALCCNEVVRLENMEETDFLALFKHHAFSGPEIRDQLLRVKLEETADKISKKLGRSPLAAKVLGTRLSKKKDIAAWKDALNIDNLSEPKSSLLWSYEKLHPRLQRCFLCCSLFPKGHKFHIKELVYLWIAEGIVDSCNQNRRMEDIGEDYINEMVSCSFFQVHSEMEYVMHDLLHDLAEDMSRDDCFRLEDDKMTEIPYTVRHLSVSVESMNKHKINICKLKHLRTVICIDPLTDDVSDLFDQTLLFSFNVDQLPDKTCNLSKLLHLAQYSGDGRYRRLGLKPVPQIPNIGKLTLLQELPSFTVQKKKGFELRQLREMNELGGAILSINDLNNVSGKDEALEAKLHLKRHLKRLSLGWSFEHDLREENSLHAEILDGLMPPPQLKYLCLVGYKSATYPSWLLEGHYFENLEEFELQHCCALQCLPTNAEIIKHCSVLAVKNVPNLKTLPCLPTCLDFFSVIDCPLLLFVSIDEPEQHDGLENTMKSNHVASQIALIWKLDSRSNSQIRRGLLREHSSLKELTPLMDTDISEHLHAIENNLDRDKEEAMVEENIINAWLYCHEQRMKLLSRGSIGTQLILPSRLTYLQLYFCNITDGALSICLGGLTSLKTLDFLNIMSLTTLPSEGVFQHLAALDSLYIRSCWLLRSLGGLRAASSLRIVSLSSCPSLGLAHAAQSMPSSLEKLDISQCLLGCDLESRSSMSLSIGHLTSLKRLSLWNLPDLCVLEGLQYLHLHDLALVNVPKLLANCISQCHVKESLALSSSVMLNDVLSAQGFTVPAHISLQSSKETAVSFEESANLSSAKCLSLFKCEMKSMPTNMKCLTGLEKLNIWGCPNIPFLPDLPSSLQHVCVEHSELLEESCREPEGESWLKIEHIRWKEIGGSSLPFQHAIWNLL
ncbi:hypothetical protein PR202_ga09443 [Eleusine coracana subsp. coracana]|uniref:Rp1-like protein n=1 Tax=Eleusine coracana subsp. coracana TaxID=191504 RepID=A0AAV5C5A1_ELECO|nr:hypothetical protein PR202_ga09443 [Eleusine coracana subsp. coracana]